MVQWSRVVILVGVCVASCNDGKPNPLGAASNPPGAPTPPANTAPAAPAPAAPPAPPASDPGFGEVAFKTFEADGKRIVFNTPTKARITWRNMVGKAVEGTYTQNGKDIEIQWDPAADNIGSKSEKFRQMGPCSMARYERVDKEGKVHDDSPKIYQQTKPRCDTVRITR
jgi:hypothetical protein